MKTIIQETLRSIAATLVFAVILCGAYPLIVWGAGQLLFPHQANGSLIMSKDGKIIGSEWLGQNFSSAKYFHPRPSAAGTGHDAANSSGTNLGPTSQKLMDSIKAAVAQYRTDNGLAADALVPADAVTSSAYQREKRGAANRPRRERAQSRRRASRRARGKIHRQTFARHSGRRRCKRIETQPRPRRRHYELTNARKSCCRQSPERG
jgi:K+-transporting ATPase KdpC subunit